MITILLAQGLFLWESVRKKWIGTTKLKDGVCARLRSLLTALQLFNRPHMLPVQHCQQIEGTQLLKLLICYKTYDNVYSFT